MGDNIGGIWKIQPGGNTWIAKSIAVAASHPFGVGDALYRIGGMAQEVDTVPFGAFRRKLIIGTEPGIQLRVPYIQVADSRRILPFLAAGYHDYPARKLTMIGVTGTDGKTTTTNLIFSILRAAEIPAGMISTVNV